MKTLSVANLTESGSVSARTHNLRKLKMYWGAHCEDCTRNSPSWHACVLCRLWFKVL